MSYLMEVASKLDYIDNPALLQNITNVFLVAMVSNPFIPTLFYSLYGVVGNTSNIFTSYIVQTWSIESTQRTILSNISLGFDPNCNVRC